MAALTTVINKVTYVGDGIVLVFPFSYLFYADADLNVYLNDTTNTDPAVLQTITTHYTIGAGEAGDENGGNVTMLTEPTSDEELIIEREVDLTQESAYTNYNRFPAPTVEKNLNRLTMMVQQMTETISRKPGFGIADESIGDIPTPIGDTVVGFNTAGDAFELKVIGDTGDFTFPASGILVSDGSLVLLSRSLAATGANITIDDPTGLLGNPTVDVSAMDTLIAANAKVADLASTDNGKGASGVGYEDAAGDTTETDMEGVGAELYSLLSDQNAGIVTGSYTGDGQDNRTIDTGLASGKVLKYVTVFKDVTGASNQLTWCGQSTYALSHSGSNLQGLTMGTTTFQISSQDFIVGDSTYNVNTTLYRWAAIYV